MQISVNKWLEEGSFFIYKTHKIFYKQTGQGPNLLIIHGYPFSSYEWKDVVDVLSDKFTITVLDLLGMGFSDKPHIHQYSYEEHTAILNSLLSFLQIKETHIISHDLGVSVVQELLALEQEQANTFEILSAAFANGSLFTAVYRPRLIQRLLSQTPTFIGRLISKVISKKAVTKSFKGLYGKNTQPNDALMNELWDILTYNDGKKISYLIGRLIFQKVRYQKRWIAAMKQTKCPICYICGPSDPNSGKHMGKHFEQLLPKNQVLWMPEEIGHWPMIEDQNSFLDLYMQWMDENKSK